MNLGFRTFQFAFIKAVSRLSGLKANHYPNKRLNAFQKNLFKLVEELKKEILSPNFNQVKFEEQIAYPDFLKFIENGTEFLEDSILNSIPFETIFCLKKALLDWIPPNTSFEIVTSLKNEYSFKHTLSCDEVLYILMDDIYSVKFENRLIQITVPKHEANNYLFNVALYHELGHFIDRKFGITNSFVDKYYSSLNSDDLERQYRNHFSEYFADLFATQYVGKAIAEYLDYYGENQGESETHPSIYDRLGVIDSFVDGEGLLSSDMDMEGLIEEEVVQKLVSYSNEKMGIELKVRYSKEEISYNDFENFIPPIITSATELHGIFDIGWDIWFYSCMYYPNLSLEKIYTIINNLIEKSISNYMVMEEWEKRNENVSN